MAFMIQTNDGKTLTWHVQNNKPENIGDIETMYASGDELELIKQRFVNVPYCHYATRWYGDWANFIFKNMQ